MVLLLCFKNICIQKYLQVKLFDVWSLLQNNPEYERENGIKDNKSHKVDQDNH